MSPITYDVNPVPPLLTAIVSALQVPLVSVPTVARLGSEVNVPMVVVAFILSSALALVK